MKKSTLIKIAKNPKVLISILCDKGFFNWLSDEKYLKWKYYLHFNKQLDLKNPQTFNEKLQWLKLYDRKPIYTTMVDKYAVKEYAAKIIGEEYIIPTLGVWNSFDEIDFDSLPEQFVLKCTHDSGGIVICKDKSKFDRKAARKKLNYHLRRKYYYSGREWPYKDVKPRIIAEKYMEDSIDKELRDYKFFVFSGIVRYMFIATERGREDVETKFDFFDMEFCHLNLTNGHPNADIIPHKPETFELMKKYAEKLAEGIPHARVDFYEVDGKLYFGEITFSHWGGMVPFKPEEWDRRWGEYIELPEAISGGNTG